MNARHSVPAVLFLALAASAASASDEESVPEFDGFVLFGGDDDKKSDPQHGFVHPISAPYFHEDSFITSDVRGWYVHHDFPKTGILGNGDAEVYAVQLRLALTETFQFVAYKDGVTDFDAGPLQDSGLNDVAAGFKWQFYADEESQTWMALGAGYEFAVGDSDVLQDDEEIRAWVSANKGFDDLHLGATANFFYGPDRNQGFGNSNRISWHVHADYRLTDWFSPVAEFNGYHVVEEGRQVVPFQGVDVANLGGGKGEYVITAAAGGEFRLFPSLALRAAYEFPLTDKIDLFGRRATLSAVFRF